MTKKIVCILLAVCLCVPLAACGGGSTYGVKTAQVLIPQEYSLAFRNNDPLIYYVVAGLKVLAAQGKVDELSAKWFGSKIVNFEKDATALDNLAVPQNRTFIIGVDANSFPFVYVSNDQFWGFDIELAIALTELLGWKLQEQGIEKENVYNELTSGNIDCAWGGIALSEKEVNSGLYAVYGPYISNDIVIATHDNAIVGNFKGKTLAMPSTPEALDALNSDPKLAGRLGNVIRLVGGTTECFSYLYAGRCDAILTDSTAIQYYNCH